MSRNRLPIILVLLIALVAAGFTRQVASTKRNTHRTLGGEAVSAAASRQLSRMNSFALALLLGGLRGPLVMILWTSSEAQKTEKNLEDFDTKVEWIRLLQPEFDSVHIFQMWNKAYNISVQMTSVSNKYLTIIDAIDYGQRVNIERPDNINIVYGIGGIFGDKLGSSAEKGYYSRRVREESKPHASRQKLAASDPGYRRLELDPVLDEQGRVLPKYLKPPGVVHLVDPENPKDFYDGSELPFLKQFEPYPYGVGPYGYAYNYRKRAQLLARLGSQNHAQLSDSVVDSRPALDLKSWGEAEWEQGRRTELRGFGRPVPTERAEMEGASADVALAFATNTALSEERKALLREAEFSYGLAQKLWLAADDEYVRHLVSYRSNIGVYQSHRDEIAAQGAMVAADQKYLQAMLAPTQGQPDLVAAARDAYRKSIVHWSAMILRYYTPTEITAKTLPQGWTRENLSATLAKLPGGGDADQMQQIVGASLAEFERQQSAPGDEITEYLSYIHRCNIRLKQLSQ